MGEEEDYERLAYSQRLKAAVHYTAGRICDETAQEEEVNFSRQFVAVLAETAFRQMQSFARDLELFAKHGKRSTVNSDDVKLLVRKSPALLRYMLDLSEQLEAANEEKKAAKKGRKTKKATAVPSTEQDEDSNMT